MNAPFNPADQQHADLWFAADEALRRAEADLEAAPLDTDEEEVDRLADVMFDARDALIALQPRTMVQALRRLELAMFDKTMVRTGVDFDALLADAKRLAEAQSSADAVPSSSDPHRAWLDERDAAIQVANGMLGREGYSAAVEAFMNIEDRIVETSASTLDGRTVQLLVLGQLIGQGHSLDVLTAEVWPIIEDVAAKLGSRTLASLGYTAPSEEASDD